MGKSIRDIDTIYKKARIQAAEFNDKLKSREGAAEMLGVSQSSLLNYENGVCKQVPPDVVVNMADIYNAPEIMNYYCSNECPIGKHTVTELEIKEIDRITIEIVNLLDGVPNIQKQLMNIVADGIISEDEKPILNYILESLDKISEEVQELKLCVQKNLKLT